MGYKVLIAEDEGLIAHDIANRLEALGHTVVGTAGTAEEALELVPKAEVVLMDIRLDGARDGIDVAREIRDQHRLPVIFLTAHADRHTLERAKLVEPFGYIVKPMGHYALQTTLEIAMHKHKMERQLEERENWLRTTLSSVDEAVVVTDAQGDVVMANEMARKLLGARQRILGKKLDASDPNAELSGADILALLPGDPVRLAILRDEPVPIDAQIRDQAVEGSAAPVKAGGATIGAVLTLRNVTLRRWQEQQLRQTQKMEAATRMAAGVSGDYATLLAIVRKETQRLLGRFTGQSSVRQSLEEIQQATLQAEELTRRLSGLGARHLGQPEPMSLNTLVRRIQKTVGSVVNDVLHVTLRLEPSLARIHADPVQIEQMILYLATVVGMAHPHAEKLELQTTAVDQHVRLTVCIPPGELPETLSARTVPGPGDEVVPLELSLAHGIATEYDGLLTAAEPAAGEGFQVLLPAWQEPQVAQALEEEPGTLLLIESRESVRRQLHNFFESAGFNLLEASDRDEALALLEIHSPGLETDSTPLADALDMAAATEEVHVDLVLGDLASTKGILQVPVILLDQPQVQAMTQNDLLAFVRSQLAQRITFSASA